MATNYIEEFFIGIGFDTKRVKKEAKEIDKLLDGLVSKKRKQVSAETKASKEKAKVEARIHKTTKASDADNAKHFIKQEKAKQIALAKTNAARIKQAVGNITAPTGATRKGGIGSAFTPIKAVKKVELDTQSLIDKAIEKRHNKEIKREADLHRVKITDQKALDSLAADNRKIAERQQKELAAWAKKGQNIKDTKVFRSLPVERQLSLGAKIDEAVSKKHARSLKELSMAVRDTGREFSKTTRKMREQGVVQKGLTDSTRNMIRSYASVFALFQGTVAIKRVGQDFQGMEASMLAASGGAEAAAVDMGFINSIVDDMGLSLKDTTDAYVKFKFAAKGKMAQTDIESLFKNVSMFGTALKVAPEEMKRAQKALSQMMSKGVVMSEELKMQLGDALPGAVQVFARALNMTEAQLFKQMEQGKVLAADVLPKVAAEYKRAAMEGGAYALALKGLRVQEGRLETTAQRSGKTIFDAGFAEGLSEFYSSISSSLNNMEPQLKKLGAVMGKVFDALSYALKLVTPLLQVVVDNMGILFGAGMIWKIQTFSNLVGVSLKAAFLPITAALAAAEELISLMSDDLVGVTESALGRQINLVSGTTSSLTQKDGKYYTDPSTKTKSHNIMERGEMIGNYLGDLTKEVGTKVINTISNTNHFTVASAQVYREIQQDLAVDASAGSSK